MPKHVEYKYSHKGQYKDLQDDFQYVEIYKHVSKNEKAPKMLFVLDYMPKEDLASGRLCSGQTGELLKRLLNVAHTFYRSTVSIEDWSWLVVTYNSFRTAGKPEEFKQGAEQEFESRLKHIITQYKPKVVTTFGSKPMHALNRTKIQEVDGKEQHFYGHPIKTSVTYNKQEHEFLHVPTLSLNTLVNPDSSGTQMYLAGYVARNLMNALNAKNVYAIPEIKFKPILVDSIKLFDKMLEQLIEAKIVAVDTETTNLNRRTNKLLTVQFSDRPDRAFFLPVYHKDSPFTGKELKYIKRRLRSYFEYDNKNDYQVYTNAVFDLTVLRSNLGIRFFKADVWDIQGGEFCFDPDTFVETERGKIQIKELVDMYDKPKVLSYNHETKQMEYKNILFASSHTSLERLVKLEYEGGSVKVTENHKVWSQTRQRYLEVKYLIPGETVITQSEPEPVMPKVIGIVYYGPNNSVCDINVEDNHNLFVSARQEEKSVLVHNCLDENLKVLNTVTGKGYYSLANISMQYGSDIYYRIEFGKSKRTTIESAPLSDGLIQYGCLDVVVPLMIHEKQIQKAKDIGYTKFKSMVRHQTSDMLHTFSTLEYNGVRTDIDYLFSLKTPESPILKEMNRIKTDLQQSKGVVKTNALLTTKSGAPKIGLFGVKTRHVFDIAKKEHQELLFFKVLKLEPVSYGKSKKPKVDKEFQAKYSDKKEVALFSELTKVKKLFNAYVKSFIKQWGQDDDMRYDSCIRPHFSFLDVVTGRTSAKKPSLHQIPARSELGKHIKRLFITKKGRLLIKVDYSAHEVRGWALISKDKLVADVFDVGIQLRNRFKLLPTPALLKRIELEGDVHKINAAYFFGLPIEKVDKPIRNAVKAVIFGLIYQQGIKGLAKNTKRTVEEITKLVKQFKQRFPKGVQWFEDVQNFAKQKLYVESPLGRRRHLWGLLIPKDAQNAEACTAAMLRRAVNSPVQGMGSDFMMTGAREIEKLKWKHYQDTGHYPDFKLCNSVHDSLEIDCAYEDFWIAIKYIEQGLTEYVAQRAQERNGMEFTVPLEIDFEIGPTGRDVKPWARDYAALDEILENTVAIQNKELGHDTSIKKVKKLILEEQYDQMPLWMKKQLWATGVRIKGMNKDPITDRDVKIIKKNRKESKEAA